MLKSRCHYHYLDWDEWETFPQEDGIQNIQTDCAGQCTPCGHLDFPLDMKETIESCLKDKRNYPGKSEQPFLSYIDFS